MIDLNELFYMALLTARFMPIFLLSIADTVPIYDFLSAAKNIKHACLQAIKAFHLILYLKLPFKNTINEKSLVIELAAGCV